MLKSLSISTRISMMAAALLLVCVTAACTGWLGSRSLFASLDTYADFSAKTLQTVAAERDYVSLRGRSFNYIVTGNAEDGKRVRAYFDTFPGIIDELVANNATTPALVESARVLRQKFADYLDALRNVVQIYGTSGSQAALVAYEAKVDAQSRELSPVFTDLRTQRFAVLAQIKARSLESYDETLMFIVGVSLVGLAVGIVLAVIIARGIIRPLNQMTEAMTRLSRGDASVTVPSAHGEDELSHMARAVGIFAANAETIASMTKAEETTQEIGAAISKAAGGDLTTRVSIEGKTGFLRDIGCEVNRLLEGMNKAFGDFSGKARSTAISISEASSAVGQVSEGARSQNGQLAQVALALTETSAAISDVSSGTRTASEKAVNASRAVDLGLQSVARLTTIMQSIGQNGRKINQLTQVIGEIANRTHILSLNAAIEAARAGEHGKGFVVVAQEVGKLAESAGQNAKQIAEIVEQATLDTTEGRSATDNVKAMMESISAGTADTSTVIQSVVVAIEEQQATVKRIDENVGELRTIAASNSAAAEEISATMVHLAGLADETREQISRFKTA